MNLFISANSDAADGSVSASVRLPIPLEGKYELALLYCEFVPDWNSLTELRMTYSNDDGKQTIQFEDMVTEDLATFIAELSEQLAAVYGRDMRQTKCKVRIESARDKYVLSLQKNSTLKLSKNLSSLLGLPRVITSDDTNLNKEFRPEVPHDVFDKYCLSCDELKPNFMASNGSMLRSLHFIPAAPFEKFSSSTLPVYHPLKDATLLHTLNIRLLSDDGQPIYSYSHFYVHLHIRHV